MSDSSASASPESEMQALRDLVMWRINCCSVCTKLKACHFVSYPFNISSLVFVGAASTPPPNPWAVPGVVATSLPCHGGGSAGSLPAGRRAAWFVARRASAGADGFGSQRHHKRLRAPDPGHRPVGGGRSFGIDSTRGGHTDRALRASSVPRGPRPAVTGPSRNRPRRRPRCCPYCRLRRRPGCDLRRRRSTAFPAARSTCPAEPRQPQQTKQQRTRSRAYH